MPFMKTIILYLCMTIVFFAIDMIWLGVIAKNVYRKFLGGFMTDSVKWGPAVVFYLLFIVGILIFAVLPAVEKDSFAKAVLLGALFGLFTYATYDLTNLATLKGWPLGIVFIDILWGMCLSGIVSTSGYLIAKRLV